MSSLLNSSAVKRTFVSCLALPFAVSACTASAAGDGSWKTGEEVYAKICGHCHDTGVGPELRGRHLPAPFFVAVARQGLRAMPAFPASYIDDASLQKVAEYIANAPAPAAKP